MDAGVPLWADIFMQSIPFGTLLLDLAEAARFLRIEILESLCCAKVASKIKQGVCPELFDINVKLSDKDEMKLKAQNSWAWEFPTEDVVAPAREDEADDEEDAPSVHEAYALGIGTAFEEQSEAAVAAGLLAITRDSRISAPNTTEESLRLLSLLAGKIALFL